MRNFVLFAGLILSLVAVVVADEGQTGERSYRDTFAIEPADLAPTGRNTYLILEPGYVMHLTAKDDSERADLTITVLNETKAIAGIVTRAVEERETEDGQLTEVSRNYYAISRTTGDVYYFGEEVDEYERGKVVGHEGTWLAGQGNNRFGLAMPGTAIVGERYYQEIAPDVAMDRAEIISVSDTLRTPAGRFDRVLKVEESDPLESGVIEYKYYAPGIGLIRDGALLLESYTKIAGQ